jgi:hypothetical protein
VNPFEEELLALIEQQRANLLKLGRQFVPTLTSEDILQPFDYPELELNPHFRYEEGILAGMQSALYALYAQK